MPKLTDKVKIFIVQQLACFQTPSQVADAVREEFGLVLQRNRIQSYDPTKAQGASLSRSLTELFWETRVSFKQQVSDIAIANQSYRLLTMQQSLERAISRKNDVLVLDILEQAAKETSGFYSKDRGNADDLTFAEFARQINALKVSTLPIAHDVEGEVIEHEPQQSETEVAAPAPEKKTFPGRD